MKDGNNYEAGVLGILSAKEDLDQVVQATAGVGIVRGEHDKGEPRLVDFAEAIAPFVGEEAYPRLLQLCEEGRCESLNHVVIAWETHEYVGNFD
ncbi:hypothetical protein EUGRSUZ_I02542 [Eucalyptus grandis]|uniref:Uncharacterized protein n=2 Tax=Eucalyptus grandis TaxID=71139 RepID=A0ACC3JIV6_EUCGR|nr:hypothetical protein EUGRSUZ_I02542 [Eucalyptus grandis]